MTENIDDEIKARFLASGDKPITDEKREAISAIQTAVWILAQTIEKHVPDGRQKSLAFTELEAVQMRAGRGVFIDG